EILITVEIVQPIDRRFAFADAGARTTRRLRTAEFVAPGIEQIEFEFEGGDGREIEFGEAFEHRVQCGARLADEGNAFFVAQGGENLRARGRLAPDAVERAGNGPGRSIRV